jgi:predicted transcriptional regulator YdeE
MRPKIVSRESFVVMGVIGHFNSAAENFGPLWIEYMNYHEQIEQLGTSEGHYGVYLNADHTQPIDYLAGMAVDTVEGAPKGTKIREVPAAHYAVFSCKFKNIGPTYGYIWNEWLDTSSYQQDITKLGFDYFPPGTTDGPSPIEIWFPVKQKDES